MSVAEVAERVDVAGEALDSDPDRVDREPTPGDSDPDLPPMDESSSSLADRLTEPLEGSIYDADVGELWNPEQGAENRLLVVAEEVAGLSEGLPRGVHLLIGGAELYYKHALAGNLGNDRGDEQDEQDEQTNEKPTEHAEILNYGN